MGYGPEVEMIRIAREMDLLTTPYAFKESEAEQMADAGADILVAHMGLTTKGSIGAKTALTLEESAKRVQAIHDARERRQSRNLVICTAAQLPNPRTPNLFWTIPKASSDFTAPQAPSVYPRNAPLRHRLKRLSRFN